MFGALLLAENLQLPRCGAVKLVSHCLVAHLVPTSSAIVILKPVMESIVSLKASGVFPETWLLGRDFYRDFTASSPSSAWSSPHFQKYLVAR